MIPRILHQFWDTGKPPGSVEAILHSWKAVNPEWDYRLWTDDLIVNLIREGKDDRAEAAYKACRFPAMRADLARYIVLLEFGGIYADADLTCLSPLEDFVDLNVQLILFRGFNNVWRNDFLGASQGCPVIRRFLQQSVENITGRRFPENLWQVTGPGMTTPIIEAALAEGLQAQKFQFLELREKLFKFNNDLDYRSGDLHWSIAQTRTHIYVD